MKVINEIPEPIVITFADIKVGDGFFWKGCFYIKCTDQKKENMYALRSSNGELIKLGGFIEVNKVQAHITITGRK